MRYVLQTSVFDPLTLIMTRKVAGTTDCKPLVFRLLSTKICIFFARKVAEYEQRGGIYITVQIVFVAFWTVQKKQYARIKEKTGFSSFRRYNAWRISHATRRESKRSRLPHYSIVCISWQRRNAGRRSFLFAPMIMQSIQSTPCVRDWFVN